MCHWKRVGVDPNWAGTAIKAKVVREREKEGPRAEVTTGVVDEGPPAVLEVR